MQTEKIAAIVLVIIVVGALSIYTITRPNEDGTTILDDILENIFGEHQKTITLGDCTDVHYIGRYENGNLFGYSYDDPDAKTGETPLNVFVSKNSSETPPEDYAVYSNMLGQYYAEEFIDGIQGLKVGQKYTIGPVSPDGTEGVRPQLGDIINLTEYVGTDYVFKIVDIQADVDMPSDYAEAFGNITTSLYVLREESHYIDEIIVTAYTFWENSSVVTKINETLLWMYTTPSTDIGELFTWSESDVDTQAQTVYPVNSSYVDNITDDSITVVHNPDVNTTIDVSIPSEWGFYIPYISYTVENVTADKINTSYTDLETGNTSYKDFDVTTVIQRNETQNITQEPVPGELLEIYLFSYLREMDADFQLSFTPFTETVYIDVEIVEVYKTS